MVCVLCTARCPRPELATAPRHRRPSRGRKITPNEHKPGLTPPPLCLISRSGHGPPTGRIYSARNSLMKPNTRPTNPCFSSGPCAKRPGWTLDALKACLPRPFPSRQDRQGKAGCRRSLARNPRHAQGLSLGIVPAPTPAPSRWPCGRCSGPAASTCWPGRASARDGSPTSPNS